MTGTSRPAAARAFCELFGVAVPIINAPMANIAGGALASAVASAGALGLIGGGYGNAEIGLRGLLLSGKQRFLEAYERGAANLPDLNASTSRSLAGDSSLGDALIELRAAQQTWLALWAQPALELGRTGDPPSDEFIDQDKLLFDQYRARYDRLIERVAFRRGEALNDQRRAVVIAIGVALAVTLLAGVIAMRRSRALRRSIGPPLEGLLQRLDQIGSGNLAPGPVIEGAREFRELGVGLEETASALALARHEAEQQSSQLAERSLLQAEVLSFAREVAGRLNVGYVLRGVCTHAAAVAGDSQIIVWLADSTRSSLEPFADSAGPDLQPIGLEPLLLGDGFVGRCGQYGRVIGRDKDAVDFPGQLAVPMVVGAQVTGVLQFIGHAVADLSDDAVTSLETMALHAATALDAARAHELTTNMAMTDVLTDLPNRRCLDRDLDAECAASSRYDRPLSVLMIDVDLFKSYNDEFGHQAGDVALQGVASLLSRDLRNSDRAYRYGGEEFAFVLRETSERRAATVAERVRMEVEHRFSDPRERRGITVSIGVASVPPHAATPEALLAAADAALYAAKQAGRNRISVAPPADAALPVAPAPLR